MLRPGTAFILPNIRPKAELTRDQLKLKRMQATKRVPTSIDQWKAVFSTLPQDLAHRALKSKFWTKGEEVLLSARTPVHEGRGHIQGVQIQSYVPADPVIWFVWQQGKIEIWLEQLDTSGTYMMEISCSAYTGELTVGASDAPHVVMPAQGEDHRIWVVIQEPNIDMSLVTVNGNKVNNWCFYDARVWRLE